MAILHSLPTMLLFGAAVILTAWGAVKRGRVLPFFGGLLGAAAVVADLVDGGTLREALALVLALLLLSLLPRSRGKGAEG